MSENARERNGRSNAAWRERAVVLALLALLALAAFRPSIRGNDGVGHYVYLASLMRGGDLDFSDEYRIYDTLTGGQFRFTDLPRARRTGLPSNRYGVGAPLLWSPFVAATHFVLRFVRPEAADAVGPPYAAAVGAATLAWGALGLLLLYGRLRREGPAWAALATVAGLLLATPLGFYLYAHGSMSHGVSFFAMVLALLATERAWRRPEPWPMAALGAALALVVMIRPQDATWALVLGGSAAARALFVHRRRLPRAAASLGALAAAGVIAFLPQFAAWQILTGAWWSGPTPYLDASAGAFEPWPRHALSALFSPLHGALGWHPLLAVGLAGLAWGALRGWGSQRVLARLGLAGFALQLWLVGSWSIWWAGASFGNRFFISALPFIAVGVTWALAAAGERRRGRAVALALLAALILWNAGLLVQYGTEMIPREERVPWGRVIKQNVVDVPRLVLERARGGRE